MASLFTHPKGQLALQFNWIFVLVIGAVILAFFLTIINGQQKRATAEEASELIKSLSSVFNTIQTNPDTQEVFNITKAKIEFVCEEGLSQYYIQGTGPVSTDYDVIFTPALLEGDKIVTWTQTWNAPFKTAVLTYMANDKTLFMFVTNNPSDAADPIVKLYNELPRIFKKTKMNPDALEDFSTKGYDRYVIITTIDTNNLNLPTTLKDKMHVRIIPEQYETSSTITFKHNTKTEQVTYYTTPILWGAIFTENKESYDCTIKKIVVKHDLLTEVIKERVITLQDDYGDYSSCTNFYNDAEETLNDMIGESIHNKKHYVEELQKTQAILKRGPSCARIY